MENQFYKRELRAEIKVSRENKEMGGKVTAFREKVEGKHKTTPKM